MFAYMLGNEWVTAAVAALLVGHLVSVAYAYRKRSETPAAGRTAGATATRSDEAGTCTCPDCGAENERGYRFCKRCVGELPGGSAPVQRPGGREQPY